MSLKDKFDELPEGIESGDVTELRRALMRTQKKLMETKQKVDDLVAATHTAAYDATLSFGKIAPVTEPKFAKTNKNNIIGVLTIEILH